MRQHSTSVFLSSCHHRSTVCPQSSQGSTLHPQCGATTAGPVMTPSVCSIEAISVSVVSRVVPPVMPSVAARRSGIQRVNGVRSATSWTYQIFFAASQRAPSALAVSFSVYGTFKSILMGELSAPMHRLHRLRHLWSDLWRKLPVHRAVGRFPPDRVGFTLFTPRKGIPAVPRVPTTQHSVAIISSRRA